MPSFKVFVTVTLRGSTVIEAEDVIDAMEEAEQMQEFDDLAHLEVSVDNARRID